MRFAIHGKEAHTQLEGAGNITLFFDGVAEAQTVRRDAGGQHLLNLNHRGGVKAGAHARQKIKNRRVWIGLHSIKHAGVRQCTSKAGIIVTNNLKVNNDTWAIVQTIGASLR